MYVCAQGVFADVDENSTLHCGSSVGTVGVICWHLCDAWRCGRRSIGESSSSKLKSKVLAMKGCINCGLGVKVTFHGYFQPFKNAVNESDEREAESL